MTIFHAPVPLALLAAAVLLTAWGARVQNGRALSFAGALLTCAAMVFSLLAGADLRELLTYALALLFVSLHPKKPTPCQRGEDAP